MAYDNYLAERISKVFKDKKIIAQEKKMMGGLCYMVNGKMCAGVIKDMLMARVGKEMHAAALNKDGCSPMTFTGKSLSGFVYVAPDAVDMDEDLEYWIQLCLDFNPLAKASKKRKKKKS